jgi:hypothetical protein
MGRAGDGWGLTRGRLFKLGAGAAFAIGAGTGGRALAGGETSALPLDGVGKPLGGPAYLRRETYLPHVGSAFEAHRPHARVVKVRLIQAQELRGPGESFSLLFRAQRHTPAEGGIYRFVHPSLGEFELFASPVGRGVKELDLEAVVNRIET